jgi:hypothetical protein
MSEDVGRKCLATQCIIYEIEFIVIFWVQCIAKYKFKSSISNVSICMIFRTFVDCSQLT